MKKNFKQMRINMPGDKPIKEISEDYESSSIKKEGDNDKSPKPGTGSPTHARSGMGSKEGGSPGGRLRAAGINDDANASGGKVQASSFYSEMKNAEKGNKKKVIIKAFSQIGGMKQNSMRQPDQHKMPKFSNSMFGSYCGSYSK